MSNGYTSEIKDIERLRQILSLFYVDGSRSKDDYPESFYRGGIRFVRNSFNKEDKVVSKRRDGGSFLSIDSRSYPVNPLYKTFGEKKYNRNDLFFYFGILDCLRESSKPKTCPEVVSFLAEIDDDFPENTVRAKLNELVKVGLIDIKRTSSSLYYFIKPKIQNLDNLDEVALFFCECAPVGVLGYYLTNDFFHIDDHNFIFKHDYINYALDADVLCQILSAIKAKCKLYLEYYSNSEKVDSQRKDYPSFEVCPIKVFSSTQDGRQYLYCYNYNWKYYDFYRLDKIHNISIKSQDPEYDKHLSFFNQNKNYFWGPAHSKELHSFEMIIEVEENESFIVTRLEREKRNLRLEKVSDKQYRIFGDLYHPTSLKNWIRSFYGRICKLECSDLSLKQSILEDLNLMVEDYNDI